MQYELCFTTYFIRLHIDSIGTAPLQQQLGEFHRLLNPLDVVYNFLFRHVVSVLHYLRYNIRYAYTYLKNKQL